MPKQIEDLIIALKREKPTWGAPKIMERLTMPQDQSQSGLAGQKLGIKEVDEGIWLVSFMGYDLGYIDLEQKTLQTIDNPFGTRVSPMS